MLLKAGSRGGTKSNEFVLHALVFVFRRPDAAVGWAIGSGARGVSPAKNLGLPANFVLRFVRHKFAKRRHKFGHVVC